MRNFNRDIPAEPCIPGLPHLAHASRTDPRDDLVGAEFVAGRDRHIGESVSLADQNAHSA